MATSFPVEPCPTCSEGWRLVGEQHCTECYEGRIAALVKALELIEYASRKDSLTENERLQSVRTVVCGVLSELNGVVGEVPK